MIQRLIATNPRKRWLSIVVLLVLASAGALGIWAWRQSSGDSPAGRPVPTPDFDILPGGTDPHPLHSGDILITIQHEKLANAQLKIETAVAQADPSISGGLRTTGTVEANAYKNIPVLPIAGGIVREVNFQLGDKVGRGQKLATIFSTDLADAQTVYLGLQAEIEKHHQHYKRTEQLVEIGAASREEFEQVSAEYKIEQAKLTAARQRLLLFGMNAKQIDGLSGENQMSPLISVESPFSGSIISRSVNPGEVISIGKELFRIADLSNVWVIGQLYEKDFASVRIGSIATITAPAYPGRAFTGRVSYIDPRVESQMRTSQFRIEVNNPNQMLRLGMFVDVNFGKALASNGRPIVVVPRGAVQMIGAKQVVFVTTDKSGVFVQREVSAGAEANGLIPINAGLNVGESVVTEGSFLMRAESLKLNPSQLTISAKAPVVK